MRLEIRIYCRHGMITQRYEFSSNNGKEEVKAVGMLNFRIWPTKICLLNRSGWATVFPQQIGGKWWSTIHHGKLLTVWGCQGFEQSWQRSEGTQPSQRRRQFCGRQWHSPETYIFSSKQLLSEEFLKSQMKNVHQQRATPQNLTC